MAKEGMKLEAEWGPTASALGTVAGITGYLKTTEHISKAARSLAKATLVELGNRMDDQTRTMGYGRAPLSMMYEHEAFETGEFKSNRLFKFEVNTNTTRTATVTYWFMASKKRIATPQENVDAGLIQLSGKFLDIFEKSGKTYIFRNRARVFEFGASTMVTSRKGPTGMLIEPNEGNPKPNIHRGQYRLDHSELYDGKFVGAFHQQWLALSELISKAAAKTLEKEVGAMAKSMASTPSRPRTKQFNIVFKQTERAAKSRARYRFSNYYDSEGLIERMSRE